MKHFSQAAEAFADALDIPEDVLLGAERVIITAGKRAVVENHRGILAYGEERILLRLPRGKLAIDGARLHLLALTADTVVIGGRIQRVEWE